VSALIGKTILVVEDDEDNARLYEMALRGVGATVLVASSVEDALARTSTPVDLVICDMHLPDGIGTDVIERWPATATGRPLAIALTGDCVTDIRAHLKDVGFDLVLQKPLLPEALLEKARHLVAGAS